MNTPNRSKRYTVNLTNVGSGAFATANFANELVSGRITEFTAFKTGGSGVQVQAQLKEAGSRLVFDSGPLANFPVQKFELRRPYTLGTGQHLQASVKVDQGADTAITVEIVVEV